MTPITLAVALADQDAVAEIEAAIGTSPEIEIVAITLAADDVLAIARQCVPDVLVIGADLVTMPDSTTPGPTTPGPTGPDAATGPRRGPVTDLTHPVAVGLRALCGAVNAELPAVRLLVVAPDGVNSYGAVLGGAIGCLRPSNLSDDIVDATRRAAWGEGRLTAEWARAVLGDLGKRATDRTVAGPLGRPELTPTELEVLRRTAVGASATEIATHHAVPERDVNRSAAFALMKAMRLHADRAIADRG